ncbi:hypothetical protein EPUS_04124 [Endocarpon pusillum Z07020]|uniref:Trichothecene 3-O-acetyltransferase-like N-terminal domain-containing protein n=1 Tax=Endocarpon pusillum (strain Z07020 / HMAS-L-300199) TaxID=1263415 RepID=U1GNJ1_ENDPU|nr:uncharacterized protein EPUS_04124 [Endocarpon pusillum Z07020]ERF73501.1 hypothetical protein EPUS_04124 [Endocarpon pusillum Z07020]
MPISEFLNSLRCMKPIRKPQSRLPIASNQKDRVLSDTTDSGLSESLAPSHHHSQEAPIMDMDMDTEHTITLSILDQGMPRHYTRFCLAFRLGETPATVAIARLEVFFRRVFQAEPWLAGHACPVREHCSPRHQLEIRFSQKDVENFQVKVQELPHDKCPLTYDELCELGMPPSKIPRPLVSSCPDRRPDTEPAPILDVTVNIVRGGLLIAIFLHHGVTDGASMGTIVSGQLCRDISETKLLTAVDLAEKARAETVTRLPLSAIPTNQSIGSHSEYKAALRAIGQTPSSPAPAPSASEVTSHIFRFSDATLQTLKADLNSLLQNSNSEPQIPWITTHDALQSLLWQHLTRARIPSFPATQCLLDSKTSTLLIPVNVRKRIASPLPPSYLGGAVVLAPATLPLTSLLTPTGTHQLQTDGLSKMVDKAYLLSTAITIHAAIAKCNDDYLREVLELTKSVDSVREMVDLNLDTAGGLDLCITSWAVLPVFEGPEGNDEGNGNGDGAGDGSSSGSNSNGGGSSSTNGSSSSSNSKESDIGLGMGLGLPDFVRKPWSRDAGGCIILPRDRRGWAQGEDGAGRGSGSGMGGLEVLVQLKTEDMDRLMHESSTDLD